MQQPVQSSTVFFRSVLLVSALLLIPSTYYLSFYLEDLAYTSFMASSNPVVFELHWGGVSKAVAFATFMAFVLNAAKFVLSVLIAWQRSKGQSVWLGYCTRALLIAMSVFGTTWVVAERLTAPNLDQAVQAARDEATESARRERVEVVAQLQARVDALKARENSERANLVNLFQPIIDKHDKGMDVERQIGGEFFEGRRFENHQKLHDEAVRRLQDGNLELVVKYDRLYADIDEEKNLALAAVDDRYREAGQVNKSDMLNAYESGHQGAMMFARFASGLFGTEIRVEHVISVFGVMLCLVIEFTPIALSAYTFKHLMQADAVNGDAVSEDASKPATPARQPWDLTRAMRQFDRAEALAKEYLGRRQGSDRLRPEARPA